MSRRLRRRGCPVRILSENFLATHQVDVHLWTGFPYTLCLQNGVIFNDTWRSLFKGMWRISTLASLSLPGNGAGDSRAGDGEEFRQIADRVLAGIVHPPQLFVLFVRELGSLSPQLPLRAGNGHAFSGAQTD
jgi:hypothetical protein